MKQVDNMESYDDFVQAMWMGEQDKPNLAIATLGLAGEAGEVAEKVKKHLRGDAAHNPKTETDIVTRNEQVGYELGDVLFYLSWIANYHGLTLDDIRMMNERKLNKRLIDNGTLRGDGDNR